jgi:DNA-binding transcriptional LysR family regulator
VFNSAGLLVEGALKGLGLVYTAEGQVQPFVSSGELVRVLADWCPPFSGYHLYYPSRRQPSPAFSLRVDALKYRGAD